MRTSTVILSHFLTLSQDIIGEEFWDIDSDQDLKLYRLSVRYFGGYDSVVLAPTCWSRYRYCPHFINDKSNIQRS